MPPDALHLDGQLLAGVQSTVSTSEVELLSANPGRKKLILTVISGDPVRVGPSGVTGTTGFEIGTGDGPVILSAPFCPTNAIAAIQESSLTDAEVLAQEIVEA